MNKFKKYKAILLDIDDTLYSYKAAHKIALKNIIKFIVKNFLIDENLAKELYEKARNKNHINLRETAASHNRLIYFQYICEFLDVNPLKYGIKMYNLYWDNYLENIKPFKGIYDLLDKYRGNICLITDLTAYIQYKKIKKLKLHEYCNQIVTSEEAGKEKPNPFIFMLALQKLKMDLKDVCMIGDNFNKDIIGANNLGIDSIWLNYKKKKNSYSNKSIREVSNFKQILRLI